jgi:DNA-binding response OmpR family regulator
MTLRVLTVHAWPDEAATLEPLLEQWGYELRSSGDAQMALVIANHFRPDVVILDITTPRIDVYDVARRLRSTFGEKLTLICLGGLDTEADRQRAKDAGFNHHLMKPADPQELRRLLQSSGYAQDTPP